MTTIKERFLRYVQIDTQSEDDVTKVPSTRKQFDLARLLVSELDALGAQDVQLSEHCYVTATIPANNGKATPVLGLIAHMDTSSAVSGANVQPVITTNYDGGNIKMGGALVLSPVEYPALCKYIGNEMICSDGETLLGADDKAGVAEIMTLAERLLAPQAPPHGPIRICFTPDEEVGRGVDFFDIAAFGADVAYTIDGGALGEINGENFNAASAVVTIRGISIHPGSAKGRMVNASLLAMELNARLPRDCTPACTEGYEGFFHLERISGCTDHAEAYYLIRDHDRQLFAQKKALFTQACADLNQKYGEGTVTLSLHDSYYNMKERIDPRLIEAAKSAMLAVGVQPELAPIRGGTDGARLSFMGLPCPNLCTGGHNSHGRYEFISVQSMEKIVEILLHLVTLF
ncbi:MAG: peptidase T [Clostridia bacterium]